MASQDPLEWVKSTVFYQIFPDRFAKKESELSSGHFEAWDEPPSLHGFKGGNLGGILSKLDYLQELGINGIYLNPIFASTANHRYHTYDYYQIDPILGGMGCFLELLKECHKRNMRVVLDGVFNHASRGFYQFNHTLENGRFSPFTDWFHFNSKWLSSGKQIDAYCPEPRRFAPPEAENCFDLHGYRAWWDIPALPKFNTAHPQVREFLWNVAEYWIKYGIDGWRLDVASEIDDDLFWREFRKRVKSINPQAYIVGEIWDDARRWLAGDQFDGVTNYPLGQALLGFCLKETLNYPELQRSGLKHTRPLNGYECRQVMLDLFSKYPEHAVFHQMNFVTSHDTPRLMTIGSGDIGGVCLLWTGFMTLPGAPCVYYGEEIGMAGGQDPDCRRGFEWDSHLWNQLIFQHIKRLIALRHRKISLQQGSFEVLFADEDVLLYRRESPGCTCIVGLNTKKETFQKVIGGVFFDDQKFKDNLAKKSLIWEDLSLMNKPLALAQRSTRAQPAQAGSHQQSFEPAIGAKPSRSWELHVELKARSSAVWCEF